MTIENRKHIDVHTLDKLIETVANSGVAVEAIAKVLCNDESRRLNDEEPFVGNFTHDGLFYGLELLDSELCSTAEITNQDLARN